jgi:hypothetical protein
MANNLKSRLRLLAKPTQAALFYDRDATQLRGLCLDELARRSG